MNDSLSGLVYSYLITKNDLFASERNKTGKRVHILFVEGKSDMEFLCRFLNYDLKDGNDKIRLNIKTDRILFDLNSQGKTNKSLNNLYTNNKQHQNQNDIGNYYHYDYVIECINAFMNDKDVAFKNIDCFGFADRDYGQHKNKIVEQYPISLTSMHDGETNIMRQYIDAYFDCSKDIESAVNVLSSIADICFKQGILAYTSMKLDIAGKLDSLVSKYFRKNITSRFKDLSKTNNLVGFDIDDYILKMNDEGDDSFASYITNKNVDNESLACDRFKEQHKLLISEYKKNLGQIYTFNDSVRDIFKRLLIDKAPLTGVPSDLNRVDRMFEYINGHILLNQLKINGVDFFNITFDNFFEQNFVEQLCEKIIKNNPEKMYLVEPFKKYKKYRCVENNYFVKI